MGEKDRAISADVSHITFIAQKIRESENTPAIAC